MKKLLFAAVILVGFSACSSYTCPTYSKQDVNKKEVVQKPERL